LCVFYFSGRMSALTRVKLLEEVLKLRKHSEMSKHYEISGENTEWEDILINKGITTQEDVLLGKGLNPNDVTLIFSLCFIFG
jgi:hypothetical protein